MTSKSLTFALDYDDTFTACPELWSRFIKDTQDSGHTVILVTARRDTDENRDMIRMALIEYGCNIHAVFTSLGSKLHVVEKRGIKVDIWIDDDPEKLVKGH